jgi:hypothetical protein
MKIECCSFELLKFEIKMKIESMKKNEMLIIGITKCPVLKGTYDLNMIMWNKKELEVGKNE